MKALAYLMIYSLKNRILQLRKKPALLLLYAICLVSMVSILFVYTFTDITGNMTGNFTDIRYLYGIVVLISILFAYMYVNTGLSTGGTLFSMADVGLLFVAPVTTRKILFYGLIKQLGLTFLTSIFIVYQLPNLSRIFLIKPVTILSIFVIYAIIIFFCQLVSMGIYVFSCGNPVRKNIVRGIFYGMLLIIVAAICWKYIESGNIIKSALSVVDSKAFGFLPVIGWATMFIKAAVEQNIVFMMIALLLFLISTIVIVRLFTIGEADYYEDVLLSTELNYNRLKNAKEGKRATRVKKVKVKQEETGIRKGIGAKVLFYKQILDTKRNSKFLFVDKYTIFAAIGTGIMCYIVNKPFTGFIVLGILVYILFFFTQMGGLSTELTKPYIYMIPEKSIDKLIWASMTSIIKPCIDGLIIFTVVTVILKTSPIENLFLAAAYASTGALFVSFTILCQRFLGAQPSKLITAFLGIGLFCILVTPAIVAGIVAFMFLPSALSFFAILPYIVCCILASVLVFAICRNMFCVSEYTGKI